MITEQTLNTKVAYFRAKQIKVIVVISGRLLSCSTALTTILIQWLLHSRPPAGKCIFIQYQCAPQIKVKYGGWVSPTVCFKEMVHTVPIKKSFRAVPCRFYRRAPAGLISFIFSCRFVLFAFPFSCVRNDYNICVCTYGARVHVLGRLI